GTLNVVTTSQTTEALIDVGSTGRVSAEGLINVDADSFAVSNAKSAVGAGGLQAGIAGGVVTLFDDSTTSASIGNASVIDDADEVQVDADSSRAATAFTGAAAVGAIGVGGSAATAEMNGKTTASVADNAKLGSNSAIGSLAVDATATETATATAVALSAGIISGSGSVATTSIESTVAASTGKDVQITASNAVAVTAQATPKASSSATAGSFGGATVGASVAVVEVAPTVTATIDGSDIEAGSLLVSAKVLTPGSGKTADAYAEAASGGLLLGANATVSDTSVRGRAISSLGFNTQLDVDGNTTITSRHDSDQYAETKSFAAGLAALGGAFSSGKANTVSAVNIADGSTISSGSLTLDASGNDRNLVKAKSGTGGAIAGAAAVAETDNTSITSVSVGNGTITTANLDIDATHTASFDHSTDSTSGGLLGASGAVGDHRVDAQVAVTLAGTIEAGVLDARSRNNVYKNLVSGYNVNAGAGGLLGGAAADSETVISRMTSTVTVASDTVITSGVYDVEAIVLEAANVLLADDSARLDAGGAIAVALADASVIANNVAASVTVGDRASLETGGDLTAAAYSELDIQVDAKASTYGLSGAAQGQSKAIVTVNNTITADTDSVLLSSGQTRLMAGRTADNKAISQTVLAYTDLWNKTVIPVKTKPEADAYLSNNNRVNVVAGSVVAAGGDIHLVADKGNANVKGQGTGKDLYRQALEAVANFFGSLVGAKPVSLDIHGGSTTNIASESAVVDGTINAGINNKLMFYIRVNGGFIELYEGEHPDDADDAYFDNAGITPTIKLRMGAGGLEAFDAEGNVMTVVDEGNGRYSIQSSDGGLSTSIALDGQFDPLDALRTRYTQIETDLLQLRNEAGVFTDAELLQREALYDEYENLRGQLDQVSSLLNDLQSIDASSTELGDNEKLGGLIQLISWVDEANDRVDAGNKIGESVLDANDQPIIDPITRWEWQVTGLEKSKSAPDATPDTISDADNQIAAYQDNLIDPATEIDAQFDEIARLEQDTIDNGTDNTAAIATARSEINTQLLVINVYRTNTLVTEKTDNDSRFDELNAGESVVGSVAYAENAYQAITGSQPGDLAYKPMIDRLVKEQDWIDLRFAEYGKSGAVDPVFTMIDFTDKLTAKSANIRIDSASLSGSGALLANRDTRVSVINTTDAYTRISGGAEIPFSAGGKVFLNGARLENATYNSLTLVDPAVPAESMIKFFNSFAPSNLNTPGPDLLIDSDIRNYNGVVHLESLYGGVQAGISVQTGDGARIDGDTIIIKAGRDVILSYTGGIRHTGGDGKCDFDIGSSCSGSEIVPGVVAGNNVYIAGEFLNINSKIQSGYPERKITIGGNATDGYTFTSDDFDAADFVTLVTPDDGGDSFFKVSPQIVAGGYVDLYGHIINSWLNEGSPGSISEVNNGEIQVMDGYGKVVVDNQTNLDVRIEGITTGTGVTGRIRITDLDYDLSASGYNKVTEYTYNRVPGGTNTVTVNISFLGVPLDGNGNPLDTKFATTNMNVAEGGLAYNPLYGQSYSWENIVKTGWVQTKNMKKTTYLGIFPGSPKLTETNRSDKAPVSGKTIVDDLVLVLAPTDDSFRKVYDTDTSPDGSSITGWYRNGVFVKSRQEYVLWRNDYWQEERSGIDFTYTKHFVAADNPITINFVGFDTGIVDLLGQGGGFDIAGDILNGSGTTRIATGGAITQSDQGALLSTRNLSISSGSVGEREQIPGAVAAGDQPQFNYTPLRFDITPGGSLDFANVSAGDFIFEQTEGELVFGDIDANGDIWLKSAGDIYNNNTLYSAGDNTISANKVTLIAEAGSVGKANANRDAFNANGDALFVKVDTQTGADGGLEIVAANDINVEEIDGDLYLVKAASSAGDAYINVTNGSLVDNNAVESKDTRTIEQLLGIWDSMEFLTETTDDNTTSPTYDVAERNVQATETLKTREYQTYWRYRNALADPSAAVTDTTVTLSETEASFFDDPDAVAAERSAEFARLNETYGDLGNSHDETYHYEVVVGSDEYVSLTKNAGWTELELLATFGPGLLKEISDTEIRIEDANVTGNNVNITVQNGDIGTYKPDAILIDLNDVADYTELTDDQKLALLTAERRDVRLDGYDAATDSYRQMRISTFDDVDVEVTGALIADAANSERVYIGSESDLAISRIVSPGDVRVRTAGNLSDSSAAANAAVTGKDIILESGNQSIGSVTQAFTIDQLVDGSLTARAGDSIWLESTQSNVLAIDTVFATNLFSLKRTGDVVEYEPDTGVDVRADSVALEIAGSFGAAGDLVNSIDVALNPEGMLTAKIDDAAWINSPDRDLRIGSFEVAASSRIAGNGDLKLQSEDGGIVSTGGTLTLMAGGSIVDEMMMVFNDLDEVVGEDDGVRAIEALELDLIALNGDIGAADNTLDIDVTGSRGVWAEAENGGLYIESPDSDLRLRNVTAGDTSVLTSTGDIVLIQTGELRSTAGTLAFEAGGSILDESGDSLVEAVDLALQANNGTIGSAQRSIQVDSETISGLSAATGIYLTEVSGDMNIASLYNGNGDVVLHVAEPDTWLNIAKGTVDGRMLWTADNMKVESLVHGGNQQELYFEITSSTGGMADDINIKYQSDYKVRFANFEAERAIVLGDVNALRFDRILTGKWAVFANDTTSVYVDNVNSGLHKEYTIQLTNMNAPYFLDFTAGRRMIKTDASTLYYDEDWIVNFFNTQNSLTRLVEKDLASLKGPLIDLEALAEYSDDKEPVEVEDDALNMQPDDDSELYLPLYWSDM
ncbi:MAG: hypothetical protein DRQ44_00855, partial [Gammaproteobacteria bacterium]